MYFSNWILQAAWAFSIFGLVVLSLLVVCVRWRVCDCCLGCIPPSWQAQGFRRFWTIIYFVVVIVDQNLVSKQEVTGFELADSCYREPAQDRHCTHFRSVIHGEVQHPFLRIFPDDVLRDWKADSRITSVDAMCYHADHKFLIWSSDDFGCWEINAMKREDQGGFMEAPFANAPGKTAVCHYLCTNLEPPRLYSFVEKVAVAWAGNAGLFLALLAIGRSLAMRAEDPMDVEFESATMCGDPRDPLSTYFWRYVWLLTPFVVLYWSNYVFPHEPILDKILAFYAVCVSSSNVILRSTRVIPQVLWTHGQCAFVEPGDGGEALLPLGDRVLQSQAYGGSAFIASDRITMLEWLAMDPIYQKKLLQYEAVTVEEALDRTAAQSGSSPFWTSRRWNKRAASRTASSYSYERDDGSSCGVQ